MVLVQMKKLWVRKVVPTGVEQNVSQPINVDEAVLKEVTEGTDKDHRDGQQVVSSKSKEVSASSFDDIPKEGKVLNNEQSAYFWF